MRKILIPVDGSRQSEAAVRAVVAQARREPIAFAHRRVTAVLRDAPHGTLH